MRNTVLDFRGILAALYSSTKMEYLSSTFSPEVVHILQSFLSEQIYEYLLSECLNI